MDPLTHFRGHNCTETNTHTQHKGILSLYVHAYANVCVRAYIYIYMLLCVYMHVQVYTTIYAHMYVHTMSYMYTLTTTSPASRRLRAAILEAWLQNFSSNASAMKKCTSVLPSL